MNQREFWDWYHLEFVPEVRGYCEVEYGTYGACKFVEILEQCRTLIGYEGTCYSYLNYRAIFEEWAKCRFEPDLLKWVENDMKSHGVWRGRIERVTF